MSEAEVAAFPGPMARHADLRDDRARDGWPHMIAALVRGGRPRVLGVDVREVAEGCANLERDGALHAAGRGPGRTYAELRGAMIESGAAAIHRDLDTVAGVGGPGPRWRGATPAASPAPEQMAKQAAKRVGAAVRGQGRRPPSTTASF